ncbi:hypothetical protein ACJJTC_005565 [Scirpophaga incertulas]
MLIFRQCGEPNHMYTNVCRNCISWPRTHVCACGLRGHPRHALPPTAGACYHNTIGPGPIVENNYRKDPSELYCSGCAIRGHLVHELQLSAVHGAVHRLSIRGELPRRVPTRYGAAPSAIPATSATTKYPQPTEQEAAEQEVDSLSSNRDNQGRIIQDNEVSDTSGVDTTARIYVTNEVIEKLKTDEGAIWLKEVTGKCRCHCGIRASLPQYQRQSR